MSYKLMMKSIPELRARADADGDRVDVDICRYSRADLRLRSCVFDIVWPLGLRISFESFYYTCLWYPNCHRISFICISLFGCS